MIRLHATPRLRGALLPMTLAILLGCLIVAWSERDLLLRDVAELWVVSDHVAPADAIAVLGGGLDVRPFLAAELYKNGLAKIILVADAKLGPVDRLGILPSHSELNRKVLIKLGVPQQVVIGFGHEVSNTFEESQALAVWAKGAGAHSIIIPTELFPSRRQRWILNRELAPVGGHVLIDAHDPLDYTINDWWRHEQGVIDFQNEVMKYLYYRLRY